MAKAGSGGYNSGIILGLSFNAGETLHVERDTSGAFGSAVVIATFSSLQDAYTDPLPIDGVTYYYRAYVSRPGYADSAYSSTVSAEPVALLP